MKCRTQVALAVGAGYLLGRRRKARLTMALGTAALTGGLGGAAGRLLGKAGGGALPGELLGKLGPEVGQITDMVRGELFELGKTAARAAVNSQVDALTGKLHERAGSLRDRIGEGGGLTGRGGADEDAEPDGNASGESGSEPDDAVADDETADDGGAGDERPATAGPATRTSRPSAGPGRLGSEAHLARLPAAQAGQAGPPLPPAGARRGPAGPAAGPHLRPMSPPSLRGAGRRGRGRLTATPRPCDADAGEHDDRQ